MTGKVEILYWDVTDGICGDGNACCWRPLDNLGEEEQNENRRHGTPQQTPLEAQGSGTHCETSEAHDHGHTRERVDDRNRTSRRRRSGGRGLGAGGSSLGGTGRRRCGLNGHNSRGRGGCGRGGGNGSGGCGSSSGDGSTSDLARDGSVESSRHTGQRILGGEGGESELRVRGVLVRQAGELDEPHVAVGTDAGVHGVGDLGILADVEGGRDVLQASLLVDTTRAEIDGAGADCGECGSVAIIVPRYRARRVGSASGCRDGLCDVNGGRDLGEEGGGSEGESGGSAHLGCKIRSEGGGVEKVAS